MENITSQKYYWSPPRMRDKSVARCLINSALWFSTGAIAPLTPLPHRGGGHLTMSVWRHFSLSRLGRELLLTSSGWPAAARPTVHAPPPPPPLQRVLQLPRSVVEKPPVQPSLDGWTQCTRKERTCVALSWQLKATCTNEKLRMYL